MSNKSKSILTYITIILIQVLVIIYWAGVKTNYHIDELYSLGHASGFTGEIYTSQYITTSRDFEFNNWISNSVLKEYLRLSEGEKVFHSSVIKTLKSILIYKNYYGFLNIAESVSGVSGVSSVPGLVLNIILFIITDILLISFMNKLKIDKVISYLALCMFGFSGYMISTVEYIRFYMLVIMLMMGMLNCLYDLWQSDNWNRIVVLWVLILSLVYFSFMDSELTMPFFAALWCGLFLVAILKKKRKQWISCLAVCALGVIYVAWKTDILGILLRPEEYSGKPNVWINASNTIRGVNGSVISLYTGWLKGLFETHYFGHSLMLYGLCCVATIVIMVWPDKTTEDNSSIELRKLKPVTACLFVIWLILFALSMILGQGKAICLAMLLVIAIKVSVELFGISLSAVRDHISPDSWFVLIMVFAAVVFLAFDMICQFTIWRYVCFGFVTLMIVFWYVTDRLLKIKSIQYVHRTMIIVLGVFVAVNAFLPFVTRNIENMYEDEKEFVESVKELNEMDVVLVSAYDEGAISRHDTYDCINMMSDKTNIYVVDIAEYDKNKMEYPNDFILWTHEGRDVSKVLTDVENRGYSVESLGADHCSKAYVCRTGR